MSSPSAANISFLLDLSEIVKQAQNNDKNQEKSQLIEEKSQGNIYYEDELADQEGDSIISSTLLQRRKRFESTIPLPTQIQLIKLQHKFSVNPRNQGEKLPGIPANGSKTARSTDSLHKTSLAAFGSYTSRKLINNSIDNSINNSQKANDLLSSIQTPLSHSRAHLPSNFRPQTSHTLSSRVTAEAKLAKKFAKIHGKLIESAEFSMKTAQLREEIHPLTLTIPEKGPKILDHEAALQHKQNNYILQLKSTEIRAETEGNLRGVDFGSPSLQPFRTTTTNTAQMFLNQPNSAQASATLAENWLSPGYYDVKFRAIEPSLQGAVTIPPNLGHFRSLADGTPPKVTQYYDKSYKLLDKHVPEIKINNNPSRISQISSINNGYLLGKTSDLGPGRYDSAYSHNTIAENTRQAAQNASFMGSFDSSQRDLAPIQRGIGLLDPTKRLAQRVESVLSDSELGEKLQVGKMLRKQENFIKHRSKTTALLQPSGGIDSELVENMVGEANWQRMDIYERLQQKENLRSSQLLDDAVAPKLFPPKSHQNPEEPDGNPNQNSLSSPRGRKALLNLSEEMLEELAVDRELEAAEQSATTRQEKQNILVARYEIRVRRQFGGEKLQPRKPAVPLSNPASPRGRIVRNIGENEGNNERDSPPQRRNFQLLNKLNLDEKFLPENAQNQRSERFQHSAAQQAAVYDLAQQLSREKLNGLVAKRQTAELARHNRRKLHTQAAHWLLIIALSARLGRSLHVLGRRQYWRSELAHRIRAVSKIQRFYRAYRARCELRRKLVAIKGLSRVTYLLIFRMRILKKRKAAAQLRKFFATVMNPNYIRPIHSAAQHQKIIEISKSRPTSARFLGNSNNSQSLVVSIGEVVLSSASSSPKQLNSRGNSGGMARRTGFHSRNLAGLIHHFMRAVIRVQRFWRQCLREREGQLLLLYMQWERLISLWDRYQQQNKYRFMRGSRKSSMKAMKSAEPAGSSENNQGDSPSQQMLDENDSENRSKESGELNSAEFLIEASSSVPTSRFSTPSALLSSRRLSSPLMQIHSLLCTTQFSAENSFVAAAAANLSLNQYYTQYLPLLQPDHIFPPAEKRLILIAAIRKSRVSYLKLCKAHELALENYLREQLNGASAARRLLLERNPLIDEQNVGGAADSDEAAFKAQFLRIYPAPRQGKLFTVKQLIHTINAAVKIKKAENRHEKESSIRNTATAMVGLFSGGASAAATPRQSSSFFSQRRASGVISKLHLTGFSSPPDSENKGVYERLYAQKPISLPLANKSVSFVGNSRGNISLQIARGSVRSLNRRVSLVPSSVSPVSSRASSAHGTNSALPTPNQSNRPLFVISGLEEESSG
jgi:hypothetical protein